MVLFQRLSKDLSYRAFRFNDICKYTYADTKYNFIPNHSSTSPPKLYNDNACQLSFFDISPPDYGELKQAIADFSLTDCLNWFNATGLAKDDDDAIAFLRVLQMGGVR